MISLIIPHYNQLEELLVLISGVKDWGLKPDEIIIVDSSDGEHGIITKLNSIIENSSIKLILIRRANAYPGAARNIGINASAGDLLAFLDCRTLPDNNWLDSAEKQLSACPAAVGVYGKTKYIAKNHFSKLIRLSTFGSAPILTLPGSLFRRESLRITGQFIEFTRAGEDTDWMTRVKLHKLHTLSANTMTYYSGLDELTLPLLLKKWFRNYKHASKLPYLNAHKSLYYHAIVMLLLFISFNWNWVVAGWNEESNFYIPHMTKIVLSLIVLLYLYIRGIMIPLRKGANFKDLLPLTWIMVAGISALLDITKTLAFVRGRWFHG